MKTTFDIKRARSLSKTARFLAAARRRGAAQSGQALVELALVLPILLVLVFGIVEFGLALNAQSNQTQVASQVARYAAVNQDPGKEQGPEESSGTETLQAWGRSHAEQGVGSNPTASVCISFPEGAAIGKPVKVEFKTKKTWLPILNLKATSTTITGSAVTRLEALPTKYGAGCV
jgi:hypothetical protein